MARRFVSRFLLPLCEGGRVAIERPLSRRSVEALARASVEASDPIEAAAVERLARVRQTLLAGLVPRTSEPRLDEATWRIGGAVHNLLALAHPAIASGVGAEARVARVASEAVALAALGPAPTLAAALERHSLLARLPEVVRLDRTVHYWLGRKTYVGRPPPPRVLALPSVRAVRVETVRRSWLREVGVPPAARPAFLALTEASPLGEALDPLRLDPAPAWGRLLSVLRFPAAARLVAGRLQATGAGRAGDALGEALYRFVLRQDDGSNLAEPSPPAVAFALSFLAHLVWLDVVFGGAERDAPGANAKTTVAPSSASAHFVGAGAARERSPTEAPGRELAVLLAATERRAPDLLWPRDVSAESELGRAFAQHLRSLFDRHEVESSPRWPTALVVAAFAGGAPASARADAV